MTWDDLAVAAGVPREHAGYMLWNASAFPFDYPRNIFNQLRHSVRHKCIDRLPAEYEAEREAAHDGELYGPGPLRRGDPTNCYPRREYDRHGRRITRNGRTTR